MKSKKNVYKYQYYPESRFGGFSDCDITIIFYCRVNALLSSESVALDIGCGRGEYGEDTVSFRKGLKILKGKCRKVIGIDVDNEARHNPYIDEFYLIRPSEPWPIDTESIDLAVCDSVIEHSMNPEQLFAECNRVLKYGGYLCLKTPNIVSYFGLVSKLVKSESHDDFLKKIGIFKKIGTTYPAFYRCNTIKKVKKMMQKYAFESYVYGFEGEPGYLHFNKYLYFLGSLHQRFAPKSIKTAILAFGKKL